MAGPADDFTHISQAAVDGGDHAQWQVARIQDGPLLDVNLDKTQVIGRVTPQRVDCLQGAGQLGVLHGGLHRDAGCILLLQPVGVKVPRQHAGAQKGRFETLPFFFGKRNHLNVKRQALGTLGQSLYAGHRHGNAQAAVVLAGFAASQFCPSVSVSNWNLPLLCHSQVSV